MNRLKKSEEKNERSNADELKGTYEHTIKSAPLTKEKFSILLLVPDLTNHNVPLRAFPFSSPSSPARFMAPSI